MSLESAIVKACMFCHMLCNTRQALAGEACTVDRLRHFTESTANHQRERDDAFQPAVSLTPLPIAFRVLNYLKITHEG